MFVSRKFLWAVILFSFVASSASAADISRPITSADLVTASQLNSQLAAVKSGRIVLIHVGFLVMYKMGHIPGSQYAGPASRAEGLAALEKLVAKLPHNQEIVIYCGCCPWDNCPNIRPAFHALKQAGFLNLKVLDIPQRLGTDWTAKGFPTVISE